MMEKLKVGIIGSGGIAQGAHIPGYQKLGDQVEITALCDLNLKRAREVAGEHSVPHVFTSYEEMFDEIDLDLVSICTPNYAHKDPTVTALEAGIHVLCEKPMAMDAEEGEEMVAAARRTGNLLMIGLNNRFRGSAQVINRMRMEGVLGDIYYGKASYLRRRGIPGWGEFHIKEKSGGGPLIDIGIHVLDLTMWLMGSPEPESVTGITFCKFGQRQKVVGNPGPTWDPEEFDVEDTASAFIKFKNGAALQLEVSWAANTESTGLKSEILGDRGGASLEPINIYSEMAGELVDITPKSVPEINTHAAEIEHFVNCIRGKEELVVLPEEALNAQRILDAVYESADTGREVRL